MTIHFRSQYESDAKRYIALCGNRSMFEHESSEIITDITCATCAKIKFKEWVAAQPETVKLLAASTKYDERSAYFVEIGGTVYARIASRTSSRLGWRIRDASGEGAVPTVYHCPDSGIQRIADVPLEPGLSKETAIATVLAVSRTGKLMPKEHFDKQRAALRAEREARWEKERAAEEARRSEWVQHTDTLRILAETESLTPEERAAVRYALERLNNI